MDGAHSEKAPTRKREENVADQNAEEVANVSALDAEHEMLKRVEHHLQKRMKSLESEEAIYRAKLQQLNGGGSSGGLVVYDESSRVPAADPLVWRRGSEAARRLAETSGLSDSDDDEDDGGDASMPRDLTAPNDHGSSSRGDPNGSMLSDADAEDRPEEEGEDEDDEDDEDDAYEKAEREQLAQVAGIARARMQGQAGQASSLLNDRLGDASSIPSASWVPSDPSTFMQGSRAQALASAPALAPPLSTDEDMSEHDARGHARPLGGGKRRMPRPDADQTDRAVVGVGGGPPQARVPGMPRPRGGCPACNGRHRAHTCGKGKPRKNEREAAAALAGLLGWGGLDAPPQ